MMGERVLIIGYGNPLRGDDGLGWQAARRLVGEVRDGVEVVACHQLMPELAEPLSRAHRAVFIDAAAPGGSPGSIVMSVVQPRPAAPGAFSHHLDPSGLLELARSLYGNAPPAELITVSGQQFDFGEQLSPPVQAALENVVRLMKAL